MVGNRSGYKELYYCDIDGAYLKQVTQDKSIVVAPAWTTGGRSILYTSYKRVIQIFIRPEERMLYLILGLKYGCGTLARRTLSRGGTFTGGIRNSTFKRSAVGSCEDSPERVVPMKRVQRGLRMDQN